MKSSFTSYTVKANGKRTLEEASSELAREMDVRRRLYDKWVLEGRMSWVDAHDRLERLMTAVAVLVHYEQDRNPEGDPYMAEKS